VRKVVRVWRQSGHAFRFIVAYAPVRRGCGLGAMMAPVAGKPDGLQPPERARAMWIIILGLTVAVLDSSILNLALPDIARQLHAGAAQSVWVVNAYQLTTLLTLLPLAALGERLGYRRVYLAGMALFALASVGAMLASSMSSLIAARALQGLGASGVMAVNAALVRLIYPRALLGRGMAINSLVVAAASMAGPTVAAGVLSVASWHWLFAINLPLGAWIWWQGRRALPFNPPSTAAAPRFSVLDVLLNGAMFGLLFLGGARLGARQAGTGDAGAGWLLLLAGLAVGAVHLWRQWRRPVPLFPVDLLRIPVFALSMASSVGSVLRADARFLVPAFLAARSAGAQPYRGRPADYRLAHDHGAGGAAGWPFDRALRGRGARRRGHGGVRGGPAGHQPAGRPPRRLGRGLAPGAVRRRLCAVPVAQQPHHRHVGAAGAQRGGQRHAGHGAPDRADAGRRHPVGDLRAAPG
jgi:MFS family permease